MLVLGINDADRFCKPDHLLVIDPAEQFQLSGHPRPDAPDVIRKTVAKKFWWFQNSKTQPWEHPNMERIRIQGFSEWGYQWFEGSLPAGLTSMIPAIVLACRLGREVGIIGCDFPYPHQQHGNLPQIERFARRLRQRAPCPIVNLSRQSLLRAFTFRRVESWLCASAAAEPRT